MDDMAEWELEKELEHHTQEQRESSIAIDDALAIDPTNEELLQMKEDLKVSIKAAEHSLFQLKRARLLQEVDAMTRASEVAVPSSNASETQSLKPGEREPEQQQEPSFSIGSKCRFRHTNGSWYNGEVLSVEVESGLARVSFLSPTAENMQICRFYLQQRCRFGGNCRQSHGVEFPIHALQPFISPQWQNVPLGSTVLAVDVYEGLGLWKQAELESLDEVNQRAVVVFVSDGKKADVDYAQIALPEQAESRDASETSSEEDEDEEDEEAEVDASGGLGMGLFSEGTQRETVTFAKWEKHTRGVASKMMASMGFHEGMGLGRSGQGQVAPIEVKVLPPKQSLGYVSEKKRGSVDKNGNEGTGAAKKKTRGGKRKRQKKWAAAAFAAKVEQDRAPDVFGFINQQLAGQFDAQSKVPNDRRDSGVEAHRKKEGSERKVNKEDRRSIVAHEDEMMEIRGKISKLEEMARRNQKEKVVFDSVTRKLLEVRKALSKAEAAHASASNAVNSKEKEKKWLRF
ncbi:unnamed protein product [Calypogeia fissa]